MRLVEELWHGTPHKFDQFSTEFLGSGEGHARFGWGLYFTSKQEVAQFYRDSLTRHFTYKGRRVPDETNLHSAIYCIVNNDYDKEAAAAQWKPGTKVRTMIDGIDVNQIRVKGHIYKVRIPDENEFLLWDSLVSEQSPTVRATLAKLMNATPEMTGEAAYHVLVQTRGGDKAASLALLAAGVHGVKYLDGWSRDNGSGSYNYVLFDGAGAEITQRS